MAKLSVGQKMPDFTFDTPYETGVKMSDAAKRVTGKTAVVFLRYYGCTLCQYDIQQYALGHKDIAATGGQLLVALQSDPKKLAAQIPQGELPFDIICDPEQAIYKEFEIKPAETKEQMLDFNDPAAQAKFAALKESGLQHGEYEGDEMQLPAVMVITPDMELTACEYLTSVTDTPTPERLVELLK